MSNNTQAMPAQIIEATLASPVDVELELPILYNSEPASVSSFSVLLPIKITVVMNVPQKYVADIEGNVNVLRSEVEKSALTMGGSVVSVDIS